MQTPGDLRAIAKELRAAALSKATAEEQADLLFLAAEYEAVAAELEANGAAGLKGDIRLPNGRGDWGA